MILKDHVIYEYSADEMANMIHAYLNHVGLLDWADALNGMRLYEVTPVWDETNQPGYWRLKWRHEGIEGYGD